MDTIEAEVPLKDRLKQSYDAIAPVYNQWTLPHSATRLAYLARVLALLPHGPDDAIAALELGCGAGVPATQTLLADRRVRVVANDLSTTQIAAAKRQLGSSDRVEWAEGDMMALEMAEGSLDLVLALYSVIHLPRDEQAELLRRIAAWLRPGGLVLANFAAEAMPGAVMEQWLHEEGWMFWSGWGAEATRNLVGEAGLEVVVGETKQDVGDAEFFWLIGRKPG